MIKTHNKDNDLLIMSVLTMLFFFGLAFTLVMQLEVYNDYPSAVATFVMMKFLFAVWLYGGK